MALNLLYVDDEPLLLDLTKTFLEREGDFFVDTVVSAEEALDKITTGSYDAIISDYEMPGMNGIDLLKNVRKQGIEIPFLIFTGKGREDVVIDAINNGADFYIQKGGKPKAQFAELSHKIRQAYAHKHAKSALRHRELALSLATASTLKEAVNLC
ncbi:MAG: response regulator, partial [Methanogenium sp.]|nr:response regulator [Methanogenium sp.]